MVRTNNLILTQGDAAVVLIKEAHKALSMKTDCNGRYVYLNPRRGGMIAVAESARNVVCTGAVPVAITNCLNFGNPYKPEVYWQFSEAVAGMGEACRVFDTPVTGGNVSFYNESPTASVYPTPVIGMLGVVDDLQMITTSGFKDEGDIILMLGETHGHVGGSEYLAIVHGTIAGDAPPIDLAREKRLHQVLLESIKRKLVKSAHDCSEGGFAVAMAECCIVDPERAVGATVNVPGGSRADFQLFGEDQSRIIVSAGSEREAREILEIAREANIKCEIVGRVGGSELRLGDGVKIGVRELASAYYGAIEAAIGN
jgi:phosphoribosylformylglycinamidine synthase